MTPRPLIPWRGDPLFNHNLNNLAPFIVPVHNPHARQHGLAQRQQRRGSCPLQRLDHQRPGYRLWRANPPPPFLAPSPHKSYQFADFPYFSLLHSLLEITAKTRPTSSPAVSLPYTTFLASPRFVSTHTQTQSQYPTAQSATSSPTSFSLNLPPPPHPPPTPPRTPTTMTTGTTTKIRNQILYLPLLLQNRITTLSCTLVWTLDQQYIQLKHAPTATDTPPQMS